MISKVYPGAIPPDKLIAEHLVIVLAVYAVVVFAGQRKWLRSNELKLIGGAMIFWAIAYLLQPVLSIVRNRYHDLSTALPISLGLVAPVIAAMIFGILYIAKRSEAAGGESQKKPTKSR